MTTNDRRTRDAAIRTASLARDALQMMPEVLQRVRITSFIAGLGRRQEDTCYTCVFDFLACIDNGKELGPHLKEHRIGWAKWGGTHRTSARAFTWGPTPICRECSETVDCHECDHCGGVELPDEGCPQHNGYCDREDAGPHH